jgi:hypothetical protein
MKYNTYNDEDAAALIIRSTERRLSKLWGCGVQINTTMTSNPKTLSPLTISSIVAEVCETTLTTMRSPTRKREVVEARQIAMTMIYKLLPAISLKSVGDFFGGRDHSTVIHARQTVEDLMVDKNFRIKYRRCMDLVEYRCTGTNKEMLMLPEVV